MLIMDFYQIQIFLNFTNEIHKIFMKHFKKDPENIIETLTQPL